MKKILIELSGHAVCASWDSMDHEFQTPFSFRRYAAFMDTALHPPDSMHSNVPGSLETRFRTDDSGNDGEKEEKGGGCAKEGCVQEGSWHGDG